MRQERALFERIRKGDRTAQAELLQANAALVGSVARRYTDNEQGLSLKELNNTGRLGLEKALEVFLRKQSDQNQNRSYKFSTYATWWIRQAIHLRLGIESEERD